MIKGMKIRVKAKPNSKHESVDLQEDGIYLVKVNAPPVDGKANARIAELLAAHFKVPKSRVSLDKGTRGKLKVFIIEGL